MLGHFEDLQKAHFILKRLIGERHYSRGMFLLVIAQTVQKEGQEIIGTDYSGVNMKC